jgi:hypothetical protein
MSTTSSDDGIGTDGSEEVSSTSPSAASSEERVFVGGGSSEDEASVAGDVCEDEESGSEDGGQEESETESGTENGLEEESDEEEVETWVEHRRRYGNGHRCARCRYQRNRKEWAKLLVYKTPDGEIGTWLEQKCEVGHPWGLGCKVCHGHVMGAC